MIRVGRNNTDTTTEPTPNTVPPFAQLYKDFSSSTPGVYFTLGVNFAADDVSLATDQATQYAQTMPSGSLRAIELGNEPDLYPFTGHRPASYDFSNYLTNFQTFKLSNFQTEHICCNTGRSAIKGALNRKIPRHAKFNPYSGQ
jgi:hypothetical protein